MAHSPENKKMPFVIRGFGGEVIARGEIEGKRPSAMIANRERIKDAFDVPILPHDVERLELHVEAQQ